MLAKRKMSVIGMAVLLSVFAAGCKKKAAPPPPPAVPKPPEVVKETPPAPVIAQFTAEPGSIQRGQSSTLRWEVTGETTNISINQGVGTVQKTGSQRVNPSNSTTYTLTATGPGGTRTSTATVDVSSPPPPVEPPVTKPPVSIETRVGELQDAYFDYDKSDVRSDASDALTKDASALKSILNDFPGSVIVIEGHCDERGSAEYNLGLGDRRASAAKDFLTQLGVPGDRLKTISYGKERPQCTDSNESCWQRNRRAHFAVGQ